MYQLCRKSTIKCEGQDKCPNFQNHLINIIYLPPSTPCWAVSRSKILIHQSIFDPAYLNILKYFSHPCFFGKKNHIFFALLVYVCEKTPKKQLCLIFLQKTDSFVRCILYNYHFICFFILTHIFQWLQCMKQFIFMFFSSVWMWSINMFFNRSGNISIMQLSFTMAVTFWVLIFSWCKISNKGAVWFM